MSPVSGSTGWELKTAYDARVYLVGADRRQSRTCAIAALLADAPVRDAEARAVQLYRHGRVLVNRPVIERGYSLAGFHSQAYPPVITFMTALITPI